MASSITLPCGCQHHERALLRRLFTRSCCPSHPEGAEIAFDELGVVAPATPFEQLSDALDFMLGFNLNTWMKGVVPHRDTWLETAEFLLKNFEKWPILGGTEPVNPPEKNEPFYAFCVYFFNNTKFVASAEALPQVAAAIFMHSNWPDGGAEMQKYWWKHSGDLINHVLPPPVKPNPPRETDRDWRNMLAVLSRVFGFACGGGKIVKYGEHLLAAFGFHEETEIKFVDVEEFSDAEKARMTKDCVGMEPEHYLDHFSDVLTIGGVRCHQYDKNPQYSILIYRDGAVHSFNRNRGEDRTDYAEMCKVEECEYVGENVTFFYEL